MARYSIVVTTYQRPDSLRSCLLSLPLDDPDFEVWVVDDGSQPAVSLDQARPNLHLLRQNNSGAAAGRNLAAAQAGGDWLVFLDDDCRVSSSWAAQLKRLCADHPRTLLGGHTRNALPANRWAAWSQLLVDCLYETYNHPPQLASFFTGNNLCCPRASFQEMGGFEADFGMSAGEDQDFCHRWSGPLHYAPELLIEHRHDLDLRAFWRQHFRYGRATQLLRQRGNRFIPKPAGFFKRLLLGSVRCRSLDCLALAQLASFCGYLYQQTQALQLGLQRRRQQTPAQDFEKGLPPLPKTPDRLPEVPASGPL